jgi:acylphosphatase
MPKRAMVKLIHADGFFGGDDANRYPAIVGNLNFVEKEYGHELEHFNMILKGIEPVFSKVLGEKIQLDHKRSGIFRRPSQFIHFEGYESLDEWCFVVALEKTSFNLWHHLGSGLGESGKADAKSALDGWEYNYRNLLEWNIDTNIVLEANQGVFFRPWMFHSLDEGKLVQYYRLLADRSIRVLIMGLPGSGKERLAKRVGKLLPNSTVLHSSKIRVKEKDIDYSVDGQMRHAYRMLEYCRLQKKENVIIDMSCPLPEMREILNPDIIIWVNTKPSSGNKEADEMFVQPIHYDARFRKIGKNEIEEVVERTLSKRV